MSRTSEKKGHKCNKPKCRGFCSTRKTWHAGKETRRKRVCRVCGTVIFTCEFNVSWEFSMVDDAGPVKKHREPRQGTPPVKVAKEKSQQRELFEVDVR